MTAPPKTPDDRYIVVDGVLWRATRPDLPEDERDRLVKDLMAARRRVGQAADDTAEHAARAAVDAAKIALGERGPLWWTDGAPDFNRHKIENTPYADWWGAEPFGKALERGDSGDSLDAMVRSILRAAALALAALAAAPAAAEWREAATDHFLIYADASEAWTQRFADRLERFDATMRLGGTMPWHPDQRSNRVVVYVVDSIAEVARLCGKCGNVAGFYSPRVGGSVIFTARTRDSTAWSIDADTILFHEYTHHLMLENFAVAYPSWFVEGYAEYHSTLDIERAGSVVVGGIAAHRAHSLLLGRKLPITALLDRPAKLAPDQISVFYGRAWLLTHILLSDTARRGQLATYLGLFAKGTPSLVAARQAFGDLDALDAQMNRAVTRPFVAHRVPADRIAVGAIAVRTLTPGEAAVMPARLRSDRGVNRAAALALVPEARRRAAPFPGDPGAQEMLAEAEFDAGNLTEAEAAADRALTVDAKRIQALIYKGRAQMRRAADGKVTDPVQWQRIRGWFTRANRVDPDAAEPLMLFYQSFFAQGVPPTANAATGLLRAFEISPQSGDLRILAARQLLFDDKPAEARAALLPLAYDPHRAGGANPAARIIALIDQGVPARDIARARTPGALQATGAARD